MGDYHHHKYNLISFHTNTKHVSMAAEVILQIYVKPEFKKSPFELSTCGQNTYNYTVCDLLFFCRLNLWCTKPR